MIKSLYHCKKDPHEIGFLIFSEECLLLYNNFTRSYLYNNILIMDYTVPKKKKTIMVPNSITGHGVGFLYKKHVS